MAFYTICGKPQCIHFAHVNYVAQFLYEHLPNFKYRKIEKPDKEWPDFVANLNKKNNWYMVKSPIIWKEISTWGGKPYLIGGLGEFWEYCYCYYGLESSISKINLAKLAQDNLTFFQDEEKSKLNQNAKFNVVITLFVGDQIEFTEHLVEQFLTIPYFISSKGIFVKLYKNSSESAGPENDKKCMENVAEYFNSMATFGNRPMLQIVDNEDEALLNCDLLIFMEDFLRKGEEDEILLDRCLIRMKELTDMIIFNAKRGLRIIFCNEGPACFMATCLVEYCPILIPTNVLVLTADKGLSVLNIISEMAKIPVARISAPPVWGFTGINEYVDESNIICKAHLFKPFKRALTAPESSTIPLGTVIPELRLMSYLVPHKHEEITRLASDRKKNIEAKLHRKPFLSKLRALKSLLELWYAEHPSDQIISLGVCSNGSYGIPPGLVFSQPCIQDSKRRWKPFPNFPLINEATLIKVQELVTESALVIEKIGRQDQLEKNYSEDVI